MGSNVFETRIYNIKPSNLHNLARGSGDDWACVFSMDDCATVGRFSEEEEGDLVAMRGAGGEAKGGKANYERLDKLLKKAPEYNPQPVLEEFRRSGQLGEFK